MPQNNSLPLSDKAHLLVPTAHGMAVALYSSASKIFKSIESLESQDMKWWDFLLTVGEIFTAVSQLNHEPLTEQDRDQLREIIADDLDKWNPRSLTALEDCTSFVDRTIGNREGETNAFSDAVGAWVVWNLFGNLPSDDEGRQLIRVLGLACVTIFIKYWTSTDI